MRQHHRVHGPPTRPDPAGRHRRPLRRAAGDSLQYPCSTETQTQTSTKAVSVARREHLARQMSGFDSRFRSNRFALYVCVQYIYMYLHFAMKSLFCSFVPRHILVNNVTRDCDVRYHFGRPLLVEPASTGIQCWMVEKTCTNKFHRKFPSEMISDDVIARVLLARTWSVRDFFVME